MSQNLVSLTLTDEQLQVVDQALGLIEGQMTGLIALNKSQRRTLIKMGEKSEVFCRQTLSLLDQNPQVVPPSMPLADAQADMVALDRLRPRMQRLRRLSERAADTEMALGSDVMVTSLQGYALLKVAGRNQGLEGQRQSLGSRFAKSPTAVDTEDPAAESAAA